MELRRGPFKSSPKVSILDPTLHSGWPRCDEQPIKTTAKWTYCEINGNWNQREIQKKKFVFNSVSYAQNVLWIARNGHRINKHSLCGSPLRVLLHCVEGETIFIEKTLVLIIFIFKVLIFNTLHIRKKKHSQPANQREKEEKQCEEKRWHYVIQKCLVVVFSILSSLFKKCISLFAQSSYLENY